MAGMLGTVYNAVLRSNTTMLFTVFGAAFGMQLYVAIELDIRMYMVLIRVSRAYDTGSEKIWNSVNKGRQWKDIKHRFMEQPEDDE
ncbi:ubiquinol-cytochrome c reductase complex 7.3 kda protein-like protein [Phaeosphaeria sp. MPI-PUGE-AT-0046c]|nr:ubiquinol-cytochrome c reductase complex 7.3 kda protein-like protein [Phaeosphaeria sp. MPI-PUGE-AT-0046c]